MSKRTPDRIMTGPVQGATSQVDKHRQVLPFSPTNEFDPFLAMMEDWFSRTGFEWHPHRGFETVTYVVDGVLEHRDNAGGQGILNEGDLQWTTTGRGVLHTEVAHERRGVHTLQLWLNLPRAKKMTDPRYQDLRMADAPILRGDDADARVFAGTTRGITGPAHTEIPVLVARLRFASGGQLSFDLPADHAGFVYVLQGAVRADGHDSTIAAGQTAWFAAGEAGESELSLHAEEDSHAFMCFGRPIGEPVVAHGPFVMTNRDEIIQAVRDYQAGTFGAIPAH